MPLFNTITRTTVFPFSSENAVASFYKWISDLFDHPQGYTVVFDRELDDPSARQQLPMPCIVVNQTDTTDPTRGFFQGERDKNSVLFYIYCMVSKTSANTGTPRLLRRMKDQVSFCLKKAGVVDESTGNLVVAPIIIYDFSKNPVADTDSTLSLKTGIMQHFSVEGEILEYELMANLEYIEGKNW